MQACAASGRVIAAAIRRDLTTYCPRCGQRLYVGNALRLSNGTGYRIPRHRSRPTPRGSTR